MEENQTPQETNDTNRIIQINIEEQMKTAGIQPNYVRLSVGLEHIEDLKVDMKRAL